MTVDVSLLTLAVVARAVRALHNTRRAPGLMPVAMAVSMPVPAGRGLGVGPVHEHGEDHDADYDEGGDEALVVVHVVIVVYVVVWKSGMRLMVCRVTSVAFYRDEIGRKRVVGGGENGIDWMQIGWA